MGFDAIPAGSAPVAALRPVRPSITFGSELRLGQTANVGEWLPGTLFAQGKTTDFLARAASAASIEERHVRRPPEDTAPLYERVLFVVNDVDPEGLLMSGGPSCADHPAVADLTLLLESGVAITPGTVSELWRRRFPAQSWLLQPENRWILGRLTKRLAGLTA